MTNATDALLPCPFCGGEARLNSEYSSLRYALCSDDACGTCGPGEWTTPEAAIAAWNRRPALHQRKENGHAG